MVKKQKHKKGGGVEPGGEMAESGPTMKMKPGKGAGMDMKPDGEMVEVSAHKRHKRQQHHPAKPGQPGEMRYIERG